MINATSADVLVIIPISTIQLSAAEFAPGHYIQPVGNAASSCLIPEVGDPIGRLCKRSVGPVVGGSIAVRIKPSGLYLNRRRNTGLGSDQRNLDIWKLTEVHRNICGDGEQTLRASLPARTCALIALSFGNIAPLALSASMRALRASTAMLKSARLT